jgi:hypothetical protein
VGYLPQGDILLDPAAQQHLDNLTVLQAVLASDSDMARAVQVGAAALVGLHTAGLGWATG